MEIILHQLQRLKINQMIRDKVNPMIPILILILILILDDLMTQVV